MKKKSIFLILFSLLLVFGLSAVAQNFISIKLDNATVQTKPCGKLIGRLKKGTTAEVLETKDKWVKVKVEGWIRKDTIKNTSQKEIEHIKTKDQNKTEEEQKNNQVNEVKQLHTVKISENFTGEKIQLKDFNNQVEITGEITNQSRIDYRLANFKISLYNKDNSLLATKNMGITDFRSKQTKTFKEVIKANYSKVEKYDIELAYTRKR